VVATPIQQIRVGIQKGDWSLVVNGFEDMTGERLTCPTRVGDGLPTEFPPGFFDHLGRAVMGYIYKYPQDGQVSGHDKPSDTSVILAVSPDLGDDEFRTGEREREDVVVATSEDPQVEPLPNEPPAEPEDEFAKFRVQHGRPKRGDGDKQACRSVPFTPGMTNTFKDDGTLETGDIAESRRLSLAKQPEKRRPESKSVEVVCGKCGRKEQVPPLLAPKSLEKGHASSYVCNHCTRKA
jgi:DNA-directed RNA polymerase subunit M/transcription elongation factor TFIIS